MIFCYFNKINLLITIFLLICNRFDTITSAQLIRISCFNGIGTKKIQPFPLVYWRRKPKSQRVGEKFKTLNK